MVASVDSIHKQHWVMKPDDDAMLDLKDALHSSSNQSLAIKERCIHASRVRVTGVSSRHCDVGRVLVSKVIPDTSSPDAPCERELLRSSSVSKSLMSSSSSSV